MLPQRLHIDDTLPMDRIDGFSNCWAVVSAFSD